MAIRFVLPDDGADCVGFAYSPLLETVLSLHVLVEPKHHPLQHPWVRRMRRLRPELKRSISELGFVFARLVPDLFGPPPDAAFRTFEEEVAMLRALDDTTIALELLRPLYDHEGKRDARLLRRPAVRRHVRAVVGSGSGAEASSSRSSSSTTPGGFSTGSPICWSGTGQRPSQTNGSCSSPSSLRPSPRRGRRLRPRGSSPCSNRCRGACGSIAAAASSGSTSRTSTGSR